jgi:serine protease Do
MASPKPSNSNSVRVNPFFTLAATVWLLPASAISQTLESAYRTTGEVVVAVFEPQRQVLQTSSAVIQDKRREIAYGVVISAQGHILTKASEIRGAGELNVTVDRTNYKDPKVLMIDPEWDVALLKIDAEDLVPVNYAPTSDVPQGTWVVANGVSTRTSRRALAGIIAAKIREVPAEGGAALGVVMKEPDGLEISEVSEKSGALAAGLQQGDLIVAIEGEALEKLSDLAERLKDRRAGSVVKLTIRRADVEMEFDVALTARGEMFADDMSRNDQMSGEFSERRSGFPRVMQHDILGAKRVVGGPLLDLDGRCLGMNIARANRTESFAIPVEDLQEIAARMMEKTADGAVVAPEAESE